MTYHGTRKLCYYFTALVLLTIALVEIIYLSGR